MRIRKLISLHQAIDRSKWYVDFAYYKLDKFGDLEWTGDSEDCELTEDELYELVKPKLVAKHTPIRRHRPAWGEEREGL